MSSWLRNSLAAVLLLSVPAWAQQRIEITALKQPVDKSYRKMVKGMDLFEKRHALAPNAALRYRLLPRKPGTDVENIRLHVVGKNIDWPIEVAADHTFVLARDRKAYREDAIVRSERRAQTMTWRADIRTPGLPSNVRRLGDLRLECQVGVEAGLVSQYPSAIDRFFDLFHGGDDYCSQREVRYLFFAEQPLFRVRLRSGERTQTLPVDKLYAAAVRGENRDELKYCDCESLIDRAYVLPLSDKSWPDDALVEIEYMDAAPQRSAVDEANDALLAGMTRAEVRAAYDNAATLRFGNGYEIWAYPASEFVVLFDPDGKVAKTQVPN